MVQRTSGKIALYNRESISLTQSRQTYSNIPLFLSSRKYAFWLLNSHKSTWEILPEAGTLRIKADGLPVDYVVIFGETPAEILANYTELTGRPPLLPRWAFGLWLTGYPQAEWVEDINLWENNIGFLANSKNAAILKEEFEKKINNAKSEVKVMEAKLKLLRAQS